MIDILLNCAKEVFILIQIVGILAAIGHYFTKHLGFKGENTLTISCIIGSVLLTLWSSLCFYISAPLMIAVALPAAGLAFSVAQPSFWVRWRGYELYCLLLVYLLIKVIVFHGGTFTFRQHNGPDIYGLAATYGLMKHSFSYSDLLHHFYHYTGLSEPRWIKPPKLLDVWSIPDAQLRFAGDQIIGSGRIGFAALLTSLSALLIKVNFFQLYILFGLVGLWCQSGLSFELMKRCTKSTPGVVSGTAFLLIISCITVSQIYLFEGLSVPIWQQVFLLLLYVLWATRLQNDSPNRMSMLASTLTVCAIYVGYPDSLILIVLLAFGALCMVTALWMARQISFSKELFYSLGPVVLVPIICSLLDSRLRNQIIVRLTDISSALNAGGAIHLGLPTYNHLIGIAKPSNALRMSQTGFSSIQQDSHIALFSVFIILLILLFGALRSYKARGWESALIFIPAIASCALPAKFLMTVWHGTPISDYVYFRSLSTYIVLSLPFLGAALWFRVKSPPLMLSNFAFLAISTYFIYIASGNYLQDSRLASPKVCWSDVDWKKSIFVSEKPNQAAFAMTACGPLFYLTDNWRPQMRSDNNTYQLYDIKFDPEKITKTHIGNIKLTTDLTGPCNLQCLKQKQLPITYDLGTKKNSIAKTGH